MTAPPTKANGVRRAVDAERSAGETGARYSAKTGALVSALSTPSAMRRGRSPKPNTAAGSQRGSTSITLVRAATSTPLLVRPRSTPPIGARSARAPIDATGSPSVDAITDAGSGFEPARLRRIDEACAADTANRSRLAGERQCRAGFDDFAERSPHLVSIARSTVSPAIKLGPSPTVSGASPRCRSGTARLRIRASTTAAQAVAATTSENGAVVTGTTRRHSIRAATRPPFARVRRSSCRGLPTVKNGIGESHAAPWR